MNNYVVLKVTFQSIQFVEYFTNLISGVILPLLHSFGATLDNQDLVLLETPLHRAIQHQMIDNIKFLIAQGVNPNKRDIKGETVLHRAATMIKDVRWVHLMQLKVELTHRNCMGQTAVDKAERARNQIAISAMSQHSNIDPKRHSSYF